MFAVLVTERAAVVEELAVVVADRSVIWCEAPQEAIDNATAAVTAAALGARRTSFPAGPGAAHDLSISGSSRRRGTFPGTDAAGKPGSRVYARVVTGVLHGSASLDLHWPPAWDAVSRTQLA